MNPILLTAALGLALLTVLLRLLTPRGQAGAFAVLADLALFLAAACVLVGIARPEGWSTSLVDGPLAKARVQPIDPRLPSHLALVLAALASVPALLAGARNARLVPALLPGVLLAAVAAAGLAFIGLSDPFALGAAAVGGFAAGVALGALVRSPGADRWRALLVLASAALAVAATICLYGGRSDPADVKQDEAVQAAGLGLAFRGLADSTTNPRVLSVEVQQGMKLREFRPALARGDSGVVKAAPAAGLFSGPVVAALAWHEENAAAHPFVWLARGDSARAKDAVLVFAGFRSEPGPPVKFYADIDVKRAGTVQRYSPGIAASSAGSDPFAVQVPELGPIAVARIDADQGRVALMVPGLEVPAGPSIATLRLQQRPGLEAAWGALAVAALALLLALVTRPAPARAR